MSLITVKAGAKGGAFKGEDGVHVATLVSVEGPKTIEPKDGREPFDIFEWTFAVDGAPEDACLVWTSTSTNSGPRSKAYGFLTALLGGRAPAVGQGFDAKDLEGRMALITIRRDADGWTKVDNVGALPIRSVPSVARAADPVPATAARPVPQPEGRPAYRTLREEVEQADRPAGDDLPF